MNGVNLSVIVATCNRRHDLSVCLRSLHNTFSKVSLLERVEVIVIDQSNGVCQSPTELGLFSNNRYEKIERQNASAARNYGASFANGRHLWFLDDDAKLQVVFPGLFDLEKHVAFVGWSEKITVFERIVSIRKLNVVRRSGTPFYIVERGVFLTVGGFDEDLGPGSAVKGGEDLDLLLRVDELIRIVDFSLVALVSHPLETADLEKKRAYFRARGRVLRKNKQWMLIFLNLAYDLSRLTIDGVWRPLCLLQGVLGRP